eukprot:2596159-Rhodomonas_salina.2
MGLFFSTHGTVRLYYAMVLCWVSTVQYYFLVLWYGTTWYSLAKDSTLKVQPWEYHTRAQYKTFHSTIHKASMRGTVQQTS